MHAQEVLDRDRDRLSSGAKSAAAQTRTTRLLRDYGRRAAPGQVLHVGQPQRHVHQRRRARHVYYVITVGASRPVRCFMLDSRSATSTSGASAVAASACRRSGPASGATYCSTYMRMVAPDEPVPARRSHHLFTQLAGKQVTHCARA